MRSCSENVNRVTYSALDPRASQLKPGLLRGRGLCDEILNRVDTPVGQARAAAFGDYGRGRAHPLERYESPEAA